MTLIRKIRKKSSKYKKQKEDQKAQSRQEVPLPLPWRRSIQRHTQDVRFVLQEFVIRPGDDGRGVGGRVAPRPDQTLADAHQGVGELARINPPGPPSAYAVRYACKERKKKRLGWSKQHAKTTQSTRRPGPSRMRQRGLDATLESTRLKGGSLRKRHPPCLCDEMQSWGGSDRGRRREEKREGGRRMRKGGGETGGGTPTRGRRTGQHR